MLFFQSLCYFWMIHPALLHGIAFLFGTFAAFSSFISITIPCICLWSPFVILNMKNENIYAKPLFLNILIFIFSWAYTSILFPDFDLPEKGIYGKAHIHVESVSYQTNLFSKKWKYECMIKNFFDNDNRLIFHSIPCTINFKDSEELARPLGNKEYLVYGTLHTNSKGKAEFTSKKKSWSIIQGGQGLAEWRFQLKQKVKKWIKNKFSTPSTALLLNGLITGEFENLSFRQLFSRFGLQHILAISGFHFNLIAGLFGWILKCIFSRKFASFFVIILMSSYTYILGNNPSVMRAWIMICLPLFGEFLEKNPNSLNLLGVSLLCLLSFDPSFSQSLSFQLSFIVTGAILLAYHPAQYVVNHIFPKRALTHVIKMKFLDQHGYCFLSLFRAGMALSLAVNLFALPLSLFYFHQFQWLGIIYNFFFPALISISFTLFFLGQIFFFIPCIEAFINGINQKFSETSLMTLYYLPESVDITWTGVFLEAEWLIAYLSVLLSLLIFWHGRKELKKHSLY